MHISDGLLPIGVCAGGLVLAGAATAVSLRRVRDRDVPRLALVTSVFFAASLLHVRLGATSVHLLLHGLTGVVAGRAAMIPIVIGVALQALLFGHGGITTIGVNAVMIGFPALAAGWVVRRFMAGACGAPRAGSKSREPDRTCGTDFPVGQETGWKACPTQVVLEHPSLVGFAVGFGAVVVSLLIFLGVGLTADRGYFSAIGVFVAAHVPLAVVEGLVTASAVGFLAKVQPEIFHASQSMDVRPADPVG